MYAITEVSSIQHYMGCCQQNNSLFVILMFRGLLTGSGCGSLHPLLEDAVVMAFLVLDQMIGAYEASCTNGTGEFFLASVHPTMAGKFIWPSEFFVTTLHWAWVWSFTGMNSNMGLKMRWFQICFSAVFIATNKGSFSVVSNWHGLGRWDYRRRHDKGWAWSNRGKFVRQDSLIRSPPWYF